MVCRFTKSIRVEKRRWPLAAPTPTFPARCARKGRRKFHALIGGKVRNAPSPASGGRLGGGRSSLQLFLELVEKAPIGALGDELLWAQFDHPDLM